MKFSKLIVLAVSLVLSVGVLGGCNANSDSNKDIIKMGTNAEFPPFEYVTNKGLVDIYDGIDIAIGNEIALSLGKKLQIENQDFTALLAAIPTGNIDFAAAGLTADPDKIPNMDFSDPYFEAIQVILVKADNTTITSAKDILDIKIGTIQTFTGEKIAKDLGVKDISLYIRATDAVADLKLDRIEAVVLDSHTAIAIQKKNSDLKIIEDTSAFEVEYYAIAVKKGNKEMLDNINKILKELKENGKLQSFIEKYGDME